MSKLLNETLSREIAERIKSKPKNPFENAYQAALTTDGAVYVQGFLAFAGKPYKPIEHSWIELGEHIVDPTLSHLGQKAQELCYFSAQQLTTKQLKAAVEEAKEDYPEDNPLPIYGAAPYEYYGDLMLGGKAYLEAFEAAVIKCTELNQKYIDRN